MHRRKVAAQDSSSNCKRTGLNQKWWVKSRKRHYGTSNAFPSYDSKTPVSLWFKIQRHYELFAVNNRHARLVRARLAQTAPVSSFAFDHDVLGNDLVERSGRSPSRFVHVRSPRQAGLTAGNKSRRYATRFGSLPVGGPPEVPGPEYRPGASHNAVFCSRRAAGALGGAGIRPLDPLAATPPASCFSAIFLSAAL